MKIRFFLFFVVCNCLSSASLACQLVPGTNYDDPTTPGLAFGIATVTSVSFENQDESGSCVSLNYIANESLIGVLPREFSVTSCNDEASMEEFQSQTKLFETLGFVSGAVVVFGLVKTEGEEPSFRYMIPDSCGAVHYRLDTLSQEERSEFVEGIKKSISEN